MRLLVVEENRALAEGLGALLRQAGHAVDLVRDGASADALLAAERHDLAVLGLDLPQMDGLEVLRAMRARRNPAAVMILTARDGPAERVRALDLGADDCMVKPFDPAEFAARIRALLRRVAGQRCVIVSFGALTLDQNTRSFRLGGRRLDLPPRERSLLELLVLRAGRIVGREAIVQSLTPVEGALSANAIEQYVSRLRRRLRPGALTIRTARGLGYRLDRLEG